MICSRPRSRVCPVYLLAACVLLGCVGVGPALASEPAGGVSVKDQIQFQQRTVEAQMQELQDRMYRLAEMTRESEPDDAARLVMAVQKAREDLIIEQMRDVLAKLAEANLSRASDEQEQVIRKLEELEKLLTSTDLDLQMQLQRLRKLNEAIAKLDAAIKEESRQHDRTGELAKQTSPPPAPRAMAAPVQEQRQNRSATESIAENVKNLGAGPAKAGTTLGAACQSMSLAEGQLGSAHAGSACDSQGQALDAMRKARQQLDEARQKILDELQSQVRKQVVENLTEMLDRQKSVRGLSEALSHQPSGVPETQQRARKLGPAESAIVRICDQTIELIDQTDFSVALPPALRQIHASCVAVADRLLSGISDGAVVSSEKQIEQDLQDLLDTFKQLASEPGPPSKCRGCKGNKNKLLAELKVIRLMQSRVNDRTARADADGLAHNIDPASPDQAQFRSTVNAIRDSQQEIRAAAERIHQELSGGN